jgi:hypothetical protein
MGGEDARDVGWRRVIRKKVAVGAGSSAVVHGLLQRHNAASELMRAPERLPSTEGIEGGKRALAHGNKPLDRTDFILRRKLASATQTTRRTST